MSEQQQDNPIPTQPPPPQQTTAAGKPIPQAVLVYHESAHSIVFRDHLRRQQGAIRRTSSIMENNSTHNGHHQILHKRSDSSGGNAPSSTTRTTSTILEGTEESTSDGGYESGGSRGSTRSVRSGNSSTSDGSNSSSASTSSNRKQYRRVKSGLTKFKSNKSTNLVTQQSSPDLQQPMAVIANFQPVIEPLESLQLHSSNLFEPLLLSDPQSNDELQLTQAELEVVDMLNNEKAVVKTIRNADWTAFLQKFKPTDGNSRHEHHPAHQKIMNADNNMKSTTHDNDNVEYPFNSFVTSTSILPCGAKKMRCFGSTNEYAVGVVFALPTAFPNDDNSEDDAVLRTKTWSWPSGYSAKTEFNIDHHGNLINGREEALVPLSSMRIMNHSYLYDVDYIVGGRMIKGGLTTIPYNEVYIRVGGHGRIVNGVDLCTGQECNDANGTGRSFDYGTGLPVALFVREVDFGHLVRLLRTRARYSAVFGVDAAKGIPLLYMTPEHGVRVFTEDLQHQVMKTMAWDLNPFQNPSLAHKTGIDTTSEPHLQQKLEELLDLDDDHLKQVLTPEEMARIAGGFGATDESVANLLNNAVQRDISEEATEPLDGCPLESGHNLQDLVNEGLAFALRANDYHTSRQLLILYTLVATKARSRSNSLNNPSIENGEGSPMDTSSKHWRETEKRNSEKEADNDERHVPLRDEDGIKHHDRELIKDERALGKDFVPPPPPPPPLDTDRLRSATNSDGLLAVLGAAQVLRAMQDGSAKRRVKESIDSIEE